MAYLIDIIKRTLLECGLFLLCMSLFSFCQVNEIIMECPEKVGQKPDSSTRIMIVPDIQNYTYLEERLKYLDAITDYYQSNKNDIDLVLQVGDLTYHNYVWQYENAYMHFINKFKQGDQMFFCLGNHDYGTNGTSDVRVSNIPEYMMPSYDLRMEESQWENYVRRVTIGGEEYGVLVLEFCTRNETLEWANTVISSDPQTPYIILLHVFLDQNGVMFDSSNPEVVNKGSSHKDYQMGNEYKNDSREIFDKIIYNNPNVKMVFCGHCLTPSYINVNYETNATGEKVYMIEVNYQHYTDGGQGCVAVLDIVNGKNYRIRSYSTYFNEYTGIDIAFGEGGLL